MICTPLGVFLSRRDSIDMVTGITKVSEIVIAQQRTIETITKLSGAMNAALNIAIDELDVDDEADRELLDRMREELLGVYEEQYGAFQE